VILLTLLVTGALTVSAQDAGKEKSETNSNGQNIQTVSDFGFRASDFPAGVTSGSAQIDHLIDQTSRRYQIPAQLIYAVIQHESRFRPRAISPEGAGGLMQLMPATARRFNVRNVFDAEQNVEAGVRYLRYLLDLFNEDLELALAGYNAGEATVMKYGYRVPPFSVTRRYVRSVLSLYEAVKGASLMSSDQRDREEGASPGEMGSSLVVERSQ